MVAPLHTATQRNTKNQPIQLVGDQLRASDGCKQAVMGLDDRSYPNACATTKPSRSTNLFLILTFHVIRFSNQSERVTAEPRIKTLRPFNMLRTSDDVVNLHDTHRSRLDWVSICGVLGGKTHTEVRGFVRSRERDSLTLLGSPGRRLRYEC